MNDQVETLNTVPCNECFYANKPKHRFCIKAEKFILNENYEKGLRPDWCPLPTDDGICPRCGADMTKQAKQGSKEVPCAECYLGSLLNGDEKENIRNIERVTSRGTELYHRHGDYPYHPVGVLHEKDQTSGLVTEAKGITEK